MEATSSGAPLRILMVSSEAFPYAKTGGLADAVSGLAVALAGAGHQVTLVLPRYDRFDTAEFDEAAAALRIPGARGEHAARLWRKRTARSLNVYLLDVPELFERPGVYGAVSGEFPDNCGRFAALCRGGLELAIGLGMRPDIVHVHDWPAALTALYLKTLYAGAPGMAGARCVLTVHNLAHQGVFPSTDLAATGLDPSLFRPAVLEFWGRINLLKAGLVAADRLTTVSPSYGEEVLTPALGNGLDGVLRERRAVFRGILNGIDDVIWDPSTDPLIPHRFAADDLTGKAACKTALAEELGLALDAREPLVGIVSRLAEQKGIDLLVPALPKLVSWPARFAVLGAGEPALEAAVRGLAAAHEGAIRVNVGFDEGLAHRIIAAADFLLMPSRFEPCGLTQFYAMRYGTVPIVHGVGGLRDSVIDVMEPGGTGFVAHEPTADAIETACRRAFARYEDGASWAALRRHIMRRDFSWKSAATGYAGLFREALAAPATLVP